MRFRAGKILSAAAAAIAYLTLCGYGKTAQLEKPLEEARKNGVSIEFLAGVAVTVYILKTLAEIIIKPAMARRASQSSGSGADGKGSLPRMFCLNTSEMKTHLQETHDTKGCVDRNAEALKELVDGMIQVQKVYIEQDGKLTQLVSANERTAKATEALANRWPGRTVR